MNKVKNILKYRIKKQKNVEQKFSFYNYTYNVISNDLTSSIFVIYHTHIECSTDLLIYFLESTYIVYIFRQKQINKL